MNNEHMREAQEGIATLEDVEEETFVGFCEFAYTGDYLSRMTERRPEIENNVTALVEEQEPRDRADVDWEVPQAVDMAAFEVQAEEPPEILDDIWSSRRTDKKKKKGTPTTKADQLWFDFRNLEYEDKHPHTSNEQAAVANGDLNSASPTTVSLLYHAKMYLFAEKYLIDTLRILSLRKFHASLRDFDLTLRTSEDILQLLEFAYRYTARQEYSDNELRVLIVHYAACKAEILKQNINLRNLLEANGEMACDLFYKI
jgi:hypothetical protein